jgi:HAD superfamily hydrolase (TIGR01509 family)
MPIRAVCFDLGGVLVRIRHYWDQAIEAAGLACGPNHAGLHLGQCAELIRFQTGELEEEEYYRLLSGYLGLSEPEQARHVHARILFEPYPGTLQLIQDLQDARILTGCLSNTNLPHWLEMGTGAFPNFEALQVRLASHDIGASKPEERAFRLFEDAAGASGSEIVFFDDGIENVEAANRLGWQAFLVDPVSDTAEFMRVQLAEVGALR